MTRRNTFKRRAIGTLIACAAAMLAAAPALSSGYVYTEDTDIDVGITSLKIMAGSVQESLSADADSLTVTVPAGEAFIIRSIYPNNWVLENNGGLATCNTIQTGDNQMTVQGPKTVNIHPSTSYYRCSTVNYDLDDTPFVVINMPAAGQELDVGQQFQLFWQTAGIGASAIRIRLSTDNGVTFDQGVTSGLVNNGFYQWTVPTVYTTDQAILKIEGMNGAGDILAIGLSPVFGIKGEDPPPEPEPESEPEPEPEPPAYDFDPAAVTATAATIDVNQAFSLPEGAETPPCTAGMRIKAKTSPAVYFCGADGKRHAFPNQRIHASWYGEEGNWGGVVEITDGSLANIPLGANVTYRPGVRMVKITTDPKVYAVASDGTLRWVTSEAVATALYGDDWNTKIDDIPDAFFVDYTIGDPIE